MEITKNKWPKTPGVYIFWQNKKRIYIGKSVNLDARLKSYFNVKLGHKTEQMLSCADKISFIKVTSELESLLLESYLIKKFKPKYNILLKDDKHALYIVITKEKFPRVLAVRKLITNHYSLITSFGPFPSTTNIKIILKLIRRIFPFSDHKLGKRSCLYSHLGLCNPCPNEIVQSTKYLVLRKKYMNNIRSIKLVLSRKFNIVRKNLEKEMNLLSNQEKYEQAKEIRERIKALDYITQKKLNEEEFIKNPNLTEDLRSLEIENLKALLNENCLPAGKAGKLQIENLTRIECFDIAHLSGSNATASMVVAINGEMEHEYYRHFRVLQSKSQSDYDSMREIAKRRVKHLADWGKPDLIIVDGGLGQVKIFDEAFQKLNIPIVGVAKNPDRLVFPDGAKVSLKVRNLQLVSRIRDEAHRFARRYHHLLLSKKLLV